MFFESFQHGASWFVCMRAVVESAVFREVEYLLEIACQLLWLDVERPESSYAGRVDDVSSRGQLQHLAERGGVHSLVVSVAYLGRLEVNPGNEPVDECRFSHSAVAAHHGGLVLERGFEFLHALASLGRESYGLVADGVVEVDHHLLVVQFLVGEQVGLVKHEHHGYPVSLCRGEESVDEGGGGLRIIHRHHEHGQIDVRRYDMALLREVRRLAYYVVSSVVYGGDEGRAFLVGHDGDAVAHGHGVGAAYALESEVALYLTIDELAAVVSLDGVPAPRIPNDES